MYDNMQSSDRLGARPRDIRLIDGFIELLELVDNTVAHLSIYTVPFSPTRSFAEISPSERRVKRQFSPTLMSRNQDQLLAPKPGISKIRPDQI